MPHDERLTPPRWFRTGARVRGVATFGGLLGIILGAVDVLPWPGSARALSLTGFLLLVLGLGLAFIPTVPRIAARPVAPPVAGRWSALNSPASRVPSHGTHGIGQTFAVDLVYEPADRARPTFGSGRAFRPPEDFPAFGQELFAPADGQVVAVRDTARDHRSRSSWLALAYMFLVEGPVRELTGARGLIGNHVILDLGDGAYATLAHLQRGSAKVRPGQRVDRGKPVARCGNSGNSSEPHLHFQLMDHRRPVIAAGLPFVFTDVVIDGSAQCEGIPANGQTMVTR